MRIAIVNDMAMAIEALRRVVTSMPGYRVAWVANDGAEAVDRCKLDTPDLILMDLMMPVMDGAEATRRIMAQTPCAILVVTGAVDDHFTKVFETLGAGALDVVQTPVLGGSKPLQGGAALKVKIEAIGRLISGQDSPRRLGWTESNGTRPALDANQTLIAIGASAGGPAALAAILAGLPADFPAAIVIVQHMDPRFIPLMAGWLNERSALPVRIALQSDAPQPNTALIAGTDDHLVFTASRSLGYTPEPRDCSYRPSIDIFFESSVRHWKGRLVGVLLTGMGRDGARGLKTMRQAGWLTIAESESSCVVYGMPKAAVALDAATKILPRNGIAGELMNFVGR